MKSAISVLMADKERYLSRALRKGVGAADSIIDGAVEVGSETIKQATKTGRKVGAAAAEEATSAYKAGAKNVKAGIGEVRRTAAGSRDIELLERLGKMWQAGVLTDEEFQHAKGKILERL